MIHVSAADILNQWVGQSEKLIKALFSVGCKVAPSIIFLDEADALLRLRKETDNGYQRSMMSQFLEESDGLKRTNTPPFLLLATNNPHDLDPAVLRRVPGRLYIGMPSCDARERLFKIFLKKECLGPNLNLKVLAKKTVRYTGSDIHTLCINAALICQDEIEWMPTSQPIKRVLMREHFIAAFKRSGPTVQAAELHKFRQFAHEYDPAAEWRVMAQERGEDDGEFHVDDGLSYRQRSVVAPKEGKEKDKGPEDHPNKDTSNIKLYRPLDSLRWEIRLLQIKSSGWSTSKVECELQTVSLLEVPSFTALSYVWGDPALQEDIIINGKVCTVRRNLARALRNSRYHWYEHFPDRDANEFRIWADAVCINQGDIVERNQQIQLMRQIYTSAELVISSLDIGDDANKLTEIAFDALNSIYDILVDEEGRPRCSMQEARAFKWLEKLPSLCDPNLEPNPWHAIDFFQAEHPYFRRVWILQEVVLAKKAVLVCGSHTIPFDKLVTLGATFGTLPENELLRPDFIPSQTWGLVQKFQAGTGLSTIGLYASIQEMYLSSEEYRNYDPDMAFSMLFVATGLLWLAASDPRDYFYGLLGLSKIDVVADYNKTVCEVYREFCQRRLNISDNHQHFLAHWSGVGFSGTSKLELPSWAPNFDSGPLSLVPKNAPDATSAFRQMRKIFAFQIKSTKWVGVGMQAQERVFTSLSGLDPYINNEYILFIPGLNLQRVVRVDRFNEDEGAKNRGISEEFVRYCAHAARRESKHNTGKQWLMVILQSLVCDSRQSLGKSSVDKATREQAFILFMLLAQWRGQDTVELDSNPWLPTDCSIFDSIYTHFLKLFLPPLYHESKSISEQQAFQEIWNRGYQGDPDRLKATSTFPAVNNMVERIHAFSACPWFETAGGYIGRGPPYMKVDDLVCVVKGCGLPILLRRNVEGYTHVGPCWVEGFMDGEAVDYFRDGRATVEWFEIR
jgi:hypothetical protein